MTDLEKLKAEIKAELLSELKPTKENKKCINSQLVNACVMKLEQCLTIVVFVLTVT